MSDGLRTECLPCSRMNRGEILVRLTGQSSSSIETNVTRAASLSRAQLFLLVFQSRKVGPGFRFLPAGYRGSSWIRLWPCGLLAPPSKRIEKMQALDQPEADFNSYFNIEQHFFALDLSD